MSRELYWLSLTTLMTAVFWVPYILNRFMELGIMGTLQNDGATKKVRADWAARAAKAHQNAVENLVVFGVLVLIAQANGTSTSLTATAAMVYFFARLVHFVVYTAGIPGARTVAFLVGFGCQLAVGLTLLGVL